MTKGSKGDRAMMERYPERAGSSKGISAKRRSSVDPERQSKRPVLPLPLSSSFTALSPNDGSNISQRRSSPSSNPTRPLTTSTSRTRSSTSRSPSLATSDPGSTSFSTNTPLSGKTGLSVQNTSASSYTSPKQPESLSVHINPPSTSMAPKWRTSSIDREDDAQTALLQSEAQSRPSSRNPYQLSVSAPSRLPSPPPSFSLNSGQPLVNPPLKTQAAFVGKLYAMLEDDEINSTGLIYWSNDGTIFTCPNPTEFSK